MPYQTNDSVSEHAERHARRSAPETEEKRRYICIVMDGVSNSKDFTGTREGAIKWAARYLDISCCHQCPEVSGNPEIIVTDYETGEIVYDDTSYSAQSAKLKAAGEKLARLATVSKKLDKWLDDCDPSEAYMELCEVNSQLIALRDATCLS